MVDRLKLKGAIVSAGFSQADVAKYLGISDNSFSNKINGKSKFYIGEAAEICKFLGIIDPNEKCQIFLN